MFVTSGRNALVRDSYLRDSWRHPQDLGGEYAATWAARDRAQAQHSHVCMNVQSLWHNESKDHMQAQA